VADFSKLLYRSIGQDPFFLDILTPLEREDATLRGARRDIRQYLREAFKLADLKTFGGRRLQPRFFTQGSAAYKTLNRPPFVPPQQMDMDDGCYLPMSFVKQAKPKLAAETFFKFVDAALGELAKQRNWKLVQKDTCVRLEISEWAHIDVPLYAIPDDQYETLAKAAMESQLITASGQINFSEAMARQPIDRWDRLPSDEVLLAHRQDNWVASDPRKIHDWFIGAVEEHGEGLRRACRYLKAWRDYNHAKIGAVSSILLMACAAAVFDKNARIMPTRDDEVLLKIAAELPTLLSGTVANPADPDSGEDLTARLDDAARKTAVVAAYDLHRILSDVINKCHIQQSAVNQVQSLFGDRVPNRPDLVKVSAPQQAKAEVLSHEPRKVAAPVVGVSTSG
jgi:hypothetical protein